MKMTTLLGFSACASLVIASQSMASGINDLDELCVIYESVRGVSLDTNVVLGENWDAANRTTGFTVRPVGLITLDYANMPGSIQAFCAEFDQAISTVAECYTRVAIADLPSTAPMGAARAAVIENHYYNNYGSVATSDSGIVNAAFQLVLWEISEEGWDGLDFNQLDLSLGAMQFQSSNADVMSIANSMIDDLTNNPNDRASLVGWEDDNSQDLITVTVVPGPSIALAGALGLVGLRRRRRN